MNNFQLGQLLSKKECDDILLKIYQLKNFWIQRSKTVPFYTLGLAAYLDKNENYCNPEKRNLYNKLLLNNFSNLINKVKICLASCLTSEVDIYINGAVPGFHIYLSHPNLKSSSIVHQQTPHMDTQFRYVFPEKGYKQKDFISFTLCLSCDNDSGLNIWKPDMELPDNVLDLLTDSSTISYSENNPLSKYTAQSIFQKPTFIKYNPGSIFIHNGVFYHYPILNAQKIPRITLQGHGIKKDGKFLIFW
jgi:hypothetical protein